MNDQAQMMNQQQQQQQPPPQMMSQPQIQMMLMNNQSKPPPQMLNRSFNSNKLWSSQQQQPQQITPLDPNMKFQSAPLNPNYAVSKLGGRSNWKGKKLSDKRNKDIRRMEKPNNIINSNNNTNTAVVSGPSNSGGGGGYKPPSLHELQSQNRLKARKFFYPNNKKKFNNMNNNNRFAPYAPRNTTSFIIRAKKAGGIAELVSPCPVTPAVLPTPIFSPSREVLGDMAKEEWGVDGYGSMKGLIRLRNESHDEEEEDENGNGGGDGSSESDVEEHVEVERRLDHDLSRFEMIYPNYGGVEYNNVLENRVDDQDSHIAQLEEENLILKKRLFLMEREMGDLRRRLQFLERQNHVMEDVNEEVVENGSDNESEGGSDAPPLPLPMMCRESNVDIVEYVSGNRSGNVGVDAKEEEEEEEENYRASYNEGISVRDVCMEEFVPDEVGAKVKIEVDGEEEKNVLVPNEIIAEEKEAKDEEIVTENVGKDDEMRIKFLRDGVIAVNDGAKGEEAADKASAKENDFKVENAKNEFVSDEVMAPVIDDANNEDRKSEFVQAGGIVEKDESKSEELGNMCSEKSIGDGD